MWFVKDLTEFAAEAKTMLSGGSVEEEGNGGNTNTASGADPSPSRPEDVVRERGEDNNGEDADYDTPRSTDEKNSSKGPSFLQRIGLVDDDDDEEEEDEEDDEGGKPSHRKEQAEAMAKLQEQLKVKDDNEQRLQAIVVAQQRRIKELEEMVVQMQMQMASTAVAAPTAATAAEIFVTGPKPSTSQPASSAATATTGRTSPTGTPTSVGTSSAVIVHTPARTEGYESWEDLSAPRVVTASRPNAALSTNSSATAAKEASTNAKATADGDEDWANFV